MREVVMAMCVRRGCAFVITFCGSSPPPCLNFFGFCLRMGFFVLISLFIDIEKLHMGLYLVGSCVWAKGGSNRTRKDRWGKKL